MTAPTFNIKFFHSIITHSLGCYISSRVYSIIYISYFNIKIITAIISVTVNITMSISFNQLHVNLYNNIISLHDIIDIINNQYNTRIRNKKELLFF